VGEVVALVESQGDARGSEGLPVSREHLARLGVAVFVESRILEQPLHPPSPAPKPCDQLRLRVVMD